MAIYKTSNGARIAYGIQVSNGSIPGVSWGAPIEGGGDGAGNVVADAAAAAILHSDSR